MDVSCFCFFAGKIDCALYGVEPHNGEVAKVYGGVDVESSVWLYEKPYFDIFCILYRGYREFLARIGAESK